MGRLRELLDELHAREVAERLADDTRAEDGWDGEGGATADPRVLGDQRALDDSASRSAPSTSPGMTDSF